VAFRLGILGAGNISDTHARAASAIPGVQVVAVHGRNRERAARLAGVYGAEVLDSLDAFLDHPMDAVAIGSPSGVHAEQGSLAASRGLHLMVEKPIDVTPARADVLIDAAARAGVRLGVFFQDRVQPDIARLRDAIVSGRFGRPLIASARVKWYRPPEYYSQSHWRGTWPLDGGGALMNQGIHTVDLLQWLLGPVRRLSATSRTAFHRIDVEDTVIALLEFESGAVATLEATTAAYPGYKRRVEISGTEGTLVLEHDRLVRADLRQPADDLVAEIAADGNQSASSPVVSDARGHQRLLEDFIEAVQSHRDPICTGQEARKSVALVCAIYEAAKSGAWVTPDRPV
jgi:UDP-N-acetyl-2-amino-2-deoxyglucuronate dehydrogenase